MAISSGAGRHYAWVSVDGGMFPVQHGTADQHATRKSSTFSALIPMSYPGADQAFSTQGVFDIFLAGARIRRRDAALAVKCSALGRFPTRSSGSTRLRIVHRAAVRCNGAVWPPLMWSQSVVRSGSSLGAD